jgi:hypothetical protein
MESVSAASVCNQGQFQVGVTCYEMKGALQRHGDCFARDHVLSASSIYDGLHRIGLSTFKSVCLSRMLAAGLVSNTKVYDENGDFVEEKFRELFKWDTNNDGALDSRELEVMKAANIQRDQTANPGLLNRFIIWMNSFKTEGEFGMVIDFLADREEQLAPTTAEQRWGNALSGLHMMTPIRLRAISFDKLARLYLGGCEVFDEKAATIAKREADFAKVRAENAAKRAANPEAALKGCI